MQDELALNTRIAHIIRALVWAKGPNSGMPLIGRQTCIPEAGSLISKRK